MMNGDILLEPKGHVKIWEGVEKSKLLVDTDNKILVGAHEQMSILIVANTPPSDYTSGGNAIGNAQIGKGNTGSSNPFTFNEWELRDGILEGDGGIVPWFQYDRTLENNTSVMFTFHFNDGDTLYNYLNGIGNPDITEIGLMVGGTVANSLGSRLFAAVDFYDDRFPVNQGIIYVAEYQIKFDVCPSA